MKSIGIMFGLCSKSVSHSIWNLLGIYGSMLGICETVFEIRFEMLLESVYALLGVTLKSGWGLFGICSESGQGPLMIGEVGGASDRRSILGSGRGERPKERPARPRVGWVGGWVGAL